MKMRQLIDAVSLLEGRDAPIYHAASFEKAMGVFVEDILEASWTHDLRHLGLGQQNGTSLTRNKRYWYPSIRWAWITFDQSLLARRHRIIPLDGDRAFAGPGHRNRTAVSDAKNGSLLDEEFVVGHVDRVHRYVTHVLVNLPTLDSDGEQTEDDAVTLREAAKAWSRKFGVPITVATDLEALSVSQRP